ncbi:MAG: HEAT repeat domain-containing protein [Verrucomicrobia bacterium]|nr:HEAT repeat domain-containing protein [Verrucomicrobiota bacterium]
MKSEIRNPKSEMPELPQPRTADHLPRPTLRRSTFDVQRSAFRVPRSAFFPFLLAALLPFPALAADLNQAVTAAMRYESGLDVVPLRQIEQAVRDAVANPSQRPALETALIRLLAPEATFEARRFACMQLASLGSDACLPAVSDLLKQPETVGIACLALGTHPSTKADDLLLQALTAHHGDTRVQIIVTLGDRRGAQAVTLLGPLARDTDRNTREAAIGALGKIASPDALALLATLRRDANTEIARLAALASLAAADTAALNHANNISTSIYEELLASDQPLYVRRAVLEGLLRMDADGGALRSLNVLRGTETALKPSALFHVRTLRDESASKVFAGELSRLSPTERVLLIDSLAARNDAAAREAIVAQTQAPDETVRQAAVVALVQVGDATVVPALVAALAKSAPSRQQPIEMALASLKGGAQVDQEIIRALETGPAAARPGLINATARRGSKSAVPALLTLAASADAATARAAFRALGQLAEPASLPAMLEHLLNLKSPAARGEAEAAAMKLLEREPDSNRRSLAVIQALSQTKDAEGRRSLIALLPACGDEPALATVKVERTSADASLREAALRALADWPNAAAVDALLTEAEQATENNERVLALRGAVRLLRQSIDLPLVAIKFQFQRALTLARNDDETKLVLSGLAGVQHGFALQLLAPHLDNPAVRAEAVQAAMTLSRRLCGAFPEPTKAVLQKLASLPIEPAVKKSAADLLEVMGHFGDFILGWQVAGPFVETGKSGEALFDVVFPPEQKDSPTTTWQIMPAGRLMDRPWQLDLASLFGGDHRVAYARTWILSETAQPARLEIGCDDGIKVWLNEQVVISANRSGDVVPGAEHAAITLNEGYNELRLKITQWTAGWGFCARIAKPDGAPLSGLNVTTVHPAVPRYLGSPAR